VTTNRIDSIDDAVSRTVVDLGWDDRGNLTTLPAVGDLRGKTFDWSVDDRLTQATDAATGAVRRYAYDGAGERVLEWWDGGTGTEARVFLRDEGGAVVSEWRNVPGTIEFGVSVDYLSLAGLPVAEIHHDGGVDRLLFVSADHLGSPRVVFDDHGNLVDHFVFEPFGEIRESGLQPPATTHLFTGHERDVGEMASGLDYMHARYFSPVLKRFISVDPVRGKIANSQSWNRYSYVLNNPMRLVDLDGENPLAAFAAFVTTTRVVAGATSGAITGGLIGLVKERSLGAALNGAAKGAVIGGANAVPVAGGAAASYTFDLGEQLVDGASLAEAHQHAFDVAAITAGAGAMALVVSPKTNAVEGAVVVAAEAWASDAVTDFVTEVVPQMELTEQDGASVKDKIEQSELLRKEGVLGNEPREDQEEAP